MSALIGLGGPGHTAEFRYYFVDKVGGIDILDALRFLAYIQTRMYINS